MRWRSRSPQTLPAPPRRRSLHPLSRRLRDRLGLRLGGGAPRALRVERVSVGGLDCKRVVLPDGRTAARVADVLHRLADSGVVPRLGWSAGRELWVEFVQGRTLCRGVGLEDAAMGVADALARLNGAAPRRVPLARTSCLPRLERDLALLAAAGVLTPVEARRLVAEGRSLAPPAVWIGDDCEDAILKNFVRGEDGRTCAVDLESLAPDALLGVGAAKAALRWLGPARPRFLARLRERGAGHLLEQLPFVELCFRAFWTRSSLLEGKRRFATRANLEPFLATTEISP